MLLSKLEIKGFKSFGDKIGIHFDSGITGIVGPNGCGKSNIVDAIRWVLGEQKIKNLRSEKMENVIFNGSKNRRPLQLAEVSLTFDNNRGLLPTEYSQVTVTRRYYRTGESEYLLNNVTCRLKDITDLFLDTGIGSDSYAIIELKMVDDLLNDKDNSRRSLFEEAAGISKFKIRKKQSLKKLEETDTDLARVEDLLFEITKNLKSLERQAKQAERHGKLRAEYKKHSIEFAKLSIDRLQQQLGSVSTDLEGQSDAKLKMASESEELEKKISQQKTDLHTEELKLSEGQRKFNAHFAAIKQLENEQTLRRQQLKHTEDKQAALLRDIATDEQQAAQLEQNIGALQEQTIALQTEVAEAENNLQGLKNATEEEKNKRTELQNQSQATNNAVRQKQQALYQQVKNIDLRKMQVQSAQDELVKIDKQRQLHLDSAVDYDALKGKLASELEVKEAELKTLQEQDMAHRQKVEETEKSLHLQREELTQHNRHLDAQKNQLNLTRSMIENLEGFPDAIKFLSKNKSWTAPAPLLSDLIVCDSRYKKAVESYLEPYMNHYVVDHPGQALEAISLLKSAQKGRANFIILSEIEELETSVTQPAAGLKPVMEVVSADVRYQQLVRYLFQEVYVAEQDVELSEISTSVTVIKEDGAIIKKPLSVTGGSVGLFAGSRIGRAKNYELLQKEVTELTAKVDVLRKQFTETENLLKSLRTTNLFQPIRVAEVAIQRLQQDILTANLKHEQQQQNQQAGDKRRQETEEKIRTLEAEILDLEPQVALEQQQLAEIEAEANQLQQQWQAQNELVNELSGKFNQANLTFHQIRNKLASLEQEINFKTTTIQTSRNRAAQNNQQLTQAKLDIEHLQNQLQQQEQLLHERLEQKTAMSRELDELQKAFLALRAANETTERDYRELQRKRQVADELIYRLQSAGNENNLKLVAIKERLSVEFNLTEEDLNNVEQLSGQSIEQLDQEIRSLRAKLDAFGPVNPMALEAYEEVSQRDVFIREQRDDLQKAKKSLLDTINEIDTVAKEKYMASFHQIRDNFIKVFQSLFTEDDSCDLIITDPGNPLESRIDIIAKPKGKRPLTINQLSGGEKTLTAISLLFAIYLLKPAPFCIFDEVDAPLDDANIDKFNKIIQQFSGQSQFIIVTHNKRTMASTDVIYGITMLEPGVSRVLPVDLRAIA